MSERAVAVDLDLDDLRPRGRTFRFRGETYEVPPKAPIPSIMEAVALQDDLRSIAGKIEVAAEPARQSAADLKEALDDLRAVHDAEHESDESREKAAKPLEEAYDAVQERYSDAMTTLTDLEADQARLNGKLLEIVLDLLHDVPGQEKIEELRLNTDEAFQIIALAAGGQPGDTLDDAIAEAVTGGTAADEPDPTPAPEAAPPAPPAKAAKPRSRSRKRSPARS